MSNVSRYLDPLLVQRLNQLQLSARRVVEGATTGSHRSPLRGASIEFRQHRRYVPGDEVRRLDWRVYGRTDRPYIKEYDEETNLRCLLLLDCSGSMGYGLPSKFDYACRVTAALAYLMLGQTESVGAGLFTGGLNHFLPPRAGTSQLSRLLNLLEPVLPSGESSPGKALHDAATRLDRRGLVILVSDLFTDPHLLHAGLAHLRHDGHEVILLQVLDDDEVNFPFTHWVRLRGLEGDGSELIEPAVARRIYLKNFQWHQDEITRLCAAQRTEYHRMITREDLIEMLTRFLRHRAE